MQILIRFYRFATVILWTLLLKTNKSVRLGRKVKVFGFPIIDVRKGCLLSIGDNVTLNSINYGYHVNMFSRIKIFLDGEKAEIIVGNNTRIHGTCLHAKIRIVIGENCLIAANTNIIDSNGHEANIIPETRIHSHDTPRPVIIEDNVWIGANCTILPGTRIGAGSVIATGSVVTKDIPKNTLASGNPAKIVKALSTDILKP